MGLISFFKPKNKKENKENYAYMQTGGTPRFSKFGESVYASDTVQQAISAIAKEMKKLNPCHIRTDGVNEELVNGDINQVLHNPNEYMTTSDFIEKCIWLLYLQYNCYVLPTFEVEVDSTGRYFRKYTGLYPLNPMEVTYYEDNQGNVSYIEMLFPRNRVLTIPYKDIIHLRLNYAINDFEGGDKYGKPNNEALLKTLKINHVLLESIGKSIQTSYAVNGFVKYNTMLADEKMENKIESFNEALRNSESGIIGFDMKSEFYPIKRDIKVVDKDTLEFLDLKVLRNYGVSIAILNGTATAEQKRAFQDTTLEPLIVMFNQAFTKKLFSQQKINGGNRVIFYANRQETMTNQQILEQAKYLRDMGAITINQALKMFGYPPIEDGNRRVQSLNYVDVEIVNQYQLNGGKMPENDSTNEDEENSGNLLGFAKKMLIKAGLSEEEADEILKEENSEEEEE